MIDLKKLINKIDYRKVFKSISEFIKNNSTVIFTLIMFISYKIVSFGLNFYFLIQQIININGNIERVKLNKDSNTKMGCRLNFLYKVCHAK